MEKRAPSRRGFVTAAASAVIAGPHILTTRKARGARPGDNGWVSLFDGKSLDGWHKNPGRIGHGTGGRWTVEDGVLAGEQDPPGSGNGGLLMTDRKLGDFELRIDMKPDWGPCSGVFFRCTEEGSAWQMYVDYHDGGNVGHLRGETPDAFAMKPFRIFGKPDRDELVGFETRPDPRAKKWPDGVYTHLCEPWQWVDAWRLDDWNTAHIRCTGKFPRITVWINGVKVGAFDGRRSTHPGYDKERVYNTLGRRGSVALQVHGGSGWPKGARVYWKNILARPL